MSHVSPPQAFHARTLPLQGLRLIEASAGTGKTYSIANLYLRLVLGMGPEQEALRVQEILVVTFTRAAAAELRSRIRSLLETAYHDLRASPPQSSHPFLAELLQGASADQCQRWRQRLYAALLDIDECSVSTIHSFALQLARSYLFESGTLADVTVSEGDGERPGRVLTDLYRQLALGANNFDQALLKSFSAHALKDFKRYYSRVSLGAELLLPPGLQFPPDLNLHQRLGLAQTHAAQQTQALATAFEALQGEWGATLAPDSDLQADLGEALDISSAQIRSLYRFFATQLQGTLPEANELGDSKSVPMKKLRARLALAGKSAPEPTPAQPFFDFAMRYKQLIAQRAAAAQRQSSSLKAAVASLVQARMADMDPQEPSLDDLVRLLNQRLEDKRTGMALREQVLRAFPVCLVDEFQDTDPEQVKLFMQLYQGPSQQRAALLMIGDPKQSIYAFRGADLGNYLQVRAGVAAAADDQQGIYALDVNYRSKAALVAATNALFAEPPEPSAASIFGLDGMRYLPVQSCEALSPPHALGSLEQAGQDQAALILIGVDDSELCASKSRLERHYAADTAHRIAQLLNGDSQLRGAQQEASEPLCPGHIAVLVRNRQQSQRVQSALALHDIRAVQLGQRDSVFQTSVLAEDLYFVLAAIDAPDDRRRLRAALATPLMRGLDSDFAALRQFDQDEQTAERLMETFTACRAGWQQLGVLPAINQLLSEEQLHRRLAAHADGDRLLTDLRHLGELLQEQDSHCDAPEQLLDWYARQLDGEHDQGAEEERLRLESDRDLVKLVTIHGAKGLEYPVVFLPFMSLLNEVKGDDLPSWHEPDAGGTVLDFTATPAQVKERLQAERQAEDMRLLYVGLTRARYRCYAGISSSKNFSFSAWARLLQAQLPEDQQNNPDWAQLQTALQQRLKGHAVAYATAHAREPTAPAASAPGAGRKRPSEAVPLQAPALLQAPTSHWRITSYSGLAHRQPVRLDAKDDDDLAAMEAPDVLADDLRWREDIRYTLRGGADTGNCLHDTLEQLALAPATERSALLLQQLQRRGLDQPLRPAGMDERDYAQRQRRYLPDLVDWLNALTAQKLLPADGAPLPSLDQLFSGGHTLPEMRFDFRLGQADRAAQFATINEALGDHGPLGWTGAISGLMTGAIDLTFVHEGAIYLADYKTNMLGAAPRFYAQAPMAQAMSARRYHLQYLIYTVAAHRYLRQRLGRDYDYEHGSYRFGGVFYLFLRGMGLGPEHAGHGLWYTRPSAEAITALDRALGADEGAADA